MEEQKRHFEQRPNNKNSDGPVMEKNQPTPQEVIPKKGLVSGCYRLTVRNKASINGEVVGYLKSNESIIILDSKNQEWHQVKLKNLVVGYVLKKYITLEEV